MGITYVLGAVQRPDRAEPAIRVRFLVDTGAIYTVLPMSVWSALELAPKRSVEFTLADGTAISRGVSECQIDLAGHSATSPVVLGEAEEGPLLGAVTLETLGLMVNPLTRRLVPMRLVLGGFSSSA